MALASPVAQPEGGLVARQDTPVDGIPAHHMREKGEHRKDRDHELREKEWMACKALFQAAKQRQHHVVKRQDDPSHTEMFEHGKKKGKKEGKEKGEEEREERKKGRKKEKGEKKEKGKERERSPERKHGEEREREHGEEHEKGQWDACMRLVHERQQHGEDASF